MSGVSPPVEANPDLVEYLMVVVPEFGALEKLIPALANLVASGAIRILDLVVIARSATDGALTVLEIDDLDSMNSWSNLEGEMGCLLSNHDIATASVALSAGSSGMLLLVEDRWAERLSSAAAETGGRIIGGERINRRRLEAVVDSSGIESRAHVDRNLVFSCPTDVPFEDRWGLLFIDRAAQVAELADLVQRGLVSAEEFERQRRCVLEPWVPSSGVLRKYVDLGDDEWTIRGPDC